MSYPVCLKKINSFEFIHLLPASLSALLKHQVFWIHQQTAGLCFPAVPAQAITAPEAPCQVPASAPMGVLQGSAVSPWKKDTIDHSSPL